MLVGQSLSCPMHLWLKFILSDEFKHLQCTFQKNLATFLKSLMILKNLLDFFEMYIANVHGSLYFFLESIYKGSFPKSRLGLNPSCGLNQQFFIISFGRLP